MLRLLLDLAILWKAGPVVLSFLGVRKLTREIDSEGATWTGTPGEAPGVEVVHPKQEDILISCAGVAYALYNLVSGNGRR